jgi:VCBS repeat-containing protein
VTTEEGGEEGTYFVDQSGHYYYQASNDQQPVMTVVSGKNQHFLESCDLYQITQCPHAFIAF